MSVAALANVIAPCPPTKLFDLARWRIAATAAAPAIITFAAVITAVVAAVVPPIVSPVIPAAPVIPTATAVVSAAIAAPTTATAATLAAAATAAAAAVVAIFAATVSIAILSCTVCAALPPVARNIVLKHKAEFIIRATEDIRHTSANSLSICGMEVGNVWKRNAFSCMVAKKNVNGKLQCHAGLLLDGTFIITAEEFHYALIERFATAVTFRFYRARLEALQNFKKLQLEGAGLDCWEDCSETPQFELKTDAFITLALFVREDFRRRSKLGDLREDKKLTNCLTFALRAGQLLGLGDQHARHWERALEAAIGPVCV